MNIIIIKDRIRELIKNIKRENIGILNDDLINKVLLDMSKEEPYTNEELLELRELIAEMAKNNY